MSFCTLARAKLHPAATQLGDTLLQALLDAATEKISTLCGSQNFVAANVVDEYRNGDGGMSIFVEQLPLNSVAALTIINGDGTTESIDLLDVAFNSATGEVRVQGGAVLFPEGWRNIRISYNGGWAACPGPIIEANVELALVLAEAASTSNSLRLGAESGDYKAGLRATVNKMGIPKLVLDLIHDYLVPPALLDRWLTTVNGTLMAYNPSSLVAGPQGPQGVQGRQGVQGWQGPRGFQGAQGWQGNQGFQGNQGNQGILGSQGPQGWQGSQGRQGNQGFQGLAGPQGNQGSQGIQGAQGRQGWQGLRGFQGIQGAQGNQGLTGHQGAQGNQGNRGFQGYQGEGVQGAQGAQGWQGSGVQGNQGVQGDLSVVLSRYQAQATAGEEVEVLATDTGITYARAGSVGTFTIPAGVRLLSVMMRLNGTSLGGSVLTLDLGTTDMGNSAEANRWQPIAHCYHEDTGLVQGVTVTATSATKSQFEVNNLSTDQVNHIRLSF